jgi:hypothetical protein
LIIKVQNALSTEFLQDASFIDPEEAFIKKTAFCSILLVRTGGGVLVLGFG